MTTTDKTIAATILQQLGGNRFRVMTGAKHMFALPEHGKILGGLTFKIGRNAKGVTHVTVELDPSDTYSVRFARVWGDKITDKGEFTDIYCDQLQELFTAQTGMETRL